MENPIVHPDSTTRDPSVPLNSIPKKRGGREQLKPRSAGFVLHSHRCKSADFCEFADAHQFHAIRTFLSENDQRQPNEEPKQTRRRYFPRTTEHLRKMLQMLSKTSEAPRLPVAVQRTSDGQEYGQIITGHPYDMGNNLSTFNVNKITRTSGNDMTKVIQKDTLPGGDVLKYIEADWPSANPAKQHVQDRNQNQNQNPGSNRSPEDTIEVLNTGSKTVAKKSVGKRQWKEDHVPACVAARIPKPFAEVPTIPSPTKSTLEYDLGISKDWLGQFSASQNFQGNVPLSRIAVSSDSDPVGRDSASNSPSPFHLNLTNRRRLPSPEKQRIEQDAVAGMSHSYPALPSFRQRFEDLRASNTHKDHISIASAVAFQEIALAAPASLVPAAQETGTGAKTLPVTSDRSNPTSVILTGSTAEDVQSDASSGVISNARSAVIMRAQSAASRYNAAISRTPPQPGPAPTRALPSLPEGHDSRSLVTPKGSKSSQTMTVPAKVAIPPKSPRRQEYSLIPAGCSPSKIKRPASSARINAAIEPEQVISLTSSPVKAKRQGISIVCLDDLPKSVSAGALGLLQKQRNEKTSARKARDLARMKAHRTTIEVVETHASSMTNRLEYHEGIAILPRVKDSDAFSLFSAEHRHQASQTSEVSASATLQSRESRTPSQKISPIIVVAEQEPIPPLNRMPSQNARVSTSSIGEHPRSFRMNGFRPGPSQPVSPSLRFPEEDFRVRPSSAHSMPTSWPVASRVPMPYAHSLLRSQSDRSSHRGIMQDLSELEARIAAQEKKNLMVERAILAVIDTSAWISGCAVSSNGIHEQDDNRSNIRGGGGDRSSGASRAENLYAGLADLLALHASEVGARLYGP